MDRIFKDIIRDIVAPIIPDRGTSESSEEAHELEVDDVELPSEDSQGTSWRWPRIFDKEPSWSVRIVHDTGTYDSRTILIVQNLETGEITEEYLDEKDKHKRDPNDTSYWTWIARAITRYYERKGLLQRKTDSMPYEWHEEFDEQFSQAKEEAKSKPRPESVPDKDLEIVAVCPLDDLTSLIEFSDGTVVRAASDSEHGDFVGTASPVNSPSSEFEASVDAGMAAEFQLSLNASAGEGGSGSGDGSGFGSGDFGGDFGGGDGGGDGGGGGGAGGGFGGDFGGSFGGGFGGGF